MSGQWRENQAGGTLTVRVPLALRKRGARKQIVAPDGSDWRPAEPRVDKAVVKALARAFRWRKMLECGRFASVTELAEAEKINQSYLCRVLRLTLLAPDIVEGILNGRQQPSSLSLAELLRPLPLEWKEQLFVLGGTSFTATPPLEALVLRSD